MSFGVGSVAYGIKDNGFATFLLLYYNQVMGLPAATVGTVIALVLVVEAFADPLVGYLSDNTRGAWGRRHPWMYGSALPVALGWLLLWNPPAGWSQGALLGYLFGAALLVRLALSMFEIPGAAIGPELSSDYDERTRLFAYRYLFGWIGGLAMLFLAYVVFLVPDATHPVGLQNPLGYSRMALAGAIAMAGAILLSSLGLHREIPHLPPAEPQEASLAAHFAAFAQTVRNKAFLILMLAGVFAYSAQGVSFALSNYMYSFVWRFEGADLMLLPLVLLIGAGSAFVLAPILTRRGDKNRAAAVLVIACGVLLAGPYLLHWLGLFPAPGRPSTTYLLFAIFAVNTAAGVAGFILGASMLSDVTEDSQRRTGRRSEGVFFAGSFFVQKLVGGLGTFLAGQILALAAFPANATPGAVSEDVVERLAILFAGVVFAGYGAAGVANWFFPFGRAAHAERIAAVRQATGAPR
ncbi:MAG: sodium:melibiose symporter [Proteobacteria bacterium SG_bin5]|nr:MAG: sodium:melibiose symporter [Proteobacteria bacterium SG_bin5]